MIRALLALAVAALLLWRGGAAPGRRRLRLLLAAALVAAGLATAGQLPDFLTTWKVRVWNVYHYYLGAKYFAELGYTGLYAATLQADAEGRGYWRDISRVRDLESYRVEERWRVEKRFDPERAFTPERWEEFRGDVEALAPQRSPRGWRGIFVDRGYNATPLWTVVGGTLARLAPAHRPAALKLLCSLDLLLLATTFWLLWRGFGAESAALVLLLLALSPVNLGRFVGGFLQYDWFCAVAAAVCLQRRRRPVAAAALMAYAVMTRVFPLLFVAAGVVPLVERWRRPARHRLRYLSAFAVFCALGFAVGLANGRGVDGWREFAAGITLHKESHVFGERRVGLQFLFTHRLGSLDFDETDDERRRIYRRQHGLYLAGAGLLVAGFLVAARRQRPWRAELLGLAPIYALLVTSRYYWSYLSLLPLAGGRRGPPAVRTRWLAAAQLVLFAGWYLFDALHGDPYAAYLLFSALLLVYLVFALAVLGPGRTRPGRGPEPAPPATG